MHFRSCIPAFFDSVLSSKPALPSNAFMNMSNEAQTKHIDQLQQDLKETRKYQNRYENLVEEITKKTDEV